MNENIDLREILKDAPKGFELYSPAFGSVEFGGIKCNSGDFYPIMVTDELGNDQFFSKGGKLFDYPDAECLLFPSKDNKDWSKFCTRWRAKIEESYWYVTLIGRISEDVDQHVTCDTDLWLAGNYFKSYEEAKNSEIYKSFPNNK